MTAAILLKNFSTHLNCIETFLKKVVYKNINIFLYTTFAFIYVYIWHINIYIYIYVYIYLHVAEPGILVAYTFTGFERDNVDYAHLPLLIFFYKWAARGIKSAVLQSPSSSILQFLQLQKWCALAAVFPHKAAITKVWFNYAYV